MFRQLIAIANNNTKTMSQAFLITLSPQLIPHRNTLN